MQRLLWLETLILTFLILAGCTRRTVAVPYVPSNTGVDSDYLDLRAGRAVTVVVPLLKAGGFQATFSTATTSGQTMTGRANDLVGYVAAKYEFVGKNDAVRFRFRSAQRSEYGSAVNLTKAPKLPFELPQRAQFLRLLYLVRVSQADHNMAIVGAKRRADLEAFTRRVQENPGVCGRNIDCFCSWIPAGVAIRPE